MNYIKGQASLSLDKALDFITSPSMRINFSARAISVLRTLEYRDPDINTVADLIANINVIKHQRNAGKKTMNEIKNIIIPILNNIQKEHLALILPKETRLNVINKPLLTPKTVQTYLNISKKILDKIIEKRLIGHYKFPDNIIRFSYNDLLLFTETYPYFER